MKFTCLQENLSHGISLVGHLALKATSLPILGNVHVSAKKGILTLSATNLEAGVQHVVRGKVEEEGECLVPARLLLDLIPLLPGGPVVATLTAEGLQMTTERDETTLRVLPTAEFPIIPSVEGGVKIECPSIDFRLALERAVVSAAKADGRPQFNGVLLVADEKKLSCVATDGFRLTEATLSLKNSATVRAIVPLVTVHEIIRLLAGSVEEEKVSLEISENQAVFKTASTNLVTRIIDGEYPDYLSLFPTKPTTSITLDSGAFAKALKATTLFARAGLAGVTMECSAENGTLTMFSESGDIGAHRSTLPIEVVGEDVKFLVNARFVLDGISGIGTTVHLQLTGPDHPLLVTSEKSTSFTYRYLVMPIRQ